MRLKRLPITCPVCGKVHTHQPSEYRKIVKSGSGLCCSRLCGHIRSMRSKGYNIAPVIDAEIQNHYILARGRV